MSITLHMGECLEVMQGMEAGSVDAVVCDPPAGIAFMGKQFDTFKGRAEFIAYLAPRCAECLRLTKPGGHALVWALPRTSHWTATALEDAGWAIEDRIAHIFGQGFPKHKSKLKPAVEDWWLCTKPGGKKWLGVEACRVGLSGEEPPSGSGDRRNGALYAQDEWTRTQMANGGNQTPPAGRYPPNIVFTHHPDCEPCGTRRVKGSHDRQKPVPGGETRENRENWRFAARTTNYANPDGMETVASWKCVDGCPVRRLDEQAGERKGDPPGRKPRVSSNGFGANFMDDDWRPKGPCYGNGYTDSGNCSRFFPTFAWEADDFTPFLYVPKASRAERGEGNTHPCVKPISLCRWLVKLACPPGGLILDPFAGSGTTLLAALAEGFDAIGIEQDPEYHAIAGRRIAAARASLPLIAGLTDR